MIPRGKLSITSGNLFKALFDSFVPKPSKYAEPHPHFGAALFCLSVRTALDLTLTSLHLPPGTEVICSNINIPDMFTILEAHQLKLVPVSINKDSLSPSVQEVEDKITSRTRVLLITHLFGAIGELDKLITLAEKHKLIVIEDCAQAFNFKYKGNPQSTVVLFSFGLIKTNTCLTGAMAIVNQSYLFDKIKALNEQLPVQPTAKYRAKIFKAFLIKLVTINWMYTFLYRFMKLLRKDWDGALAGLTRGFPGDDVRKKIAFRPCTANLNLLKKRTDSFDHHSINERTNIGNSLTKFIPEQLRIAKLNSSNTFWVLPMVSKNPDQTIAQLRRSGIDATSKASSLISLRSTNPPKGDELDLTTLVYLPVDRLSVDQLTVVTATLLSLH